jgi:hypothetical protein
MVRPRWLPRPFELFTWGMTIFVVLFLRLQGLRMDWRTVEFMAVPMLRRLPTALWLGLALQGIALLVGRAAVKPWLREVVRPAALWLWFRLWLATMAMTYAYSWLKVSIPLVHRSLFDEQLWSFDRLVHLGLSPSVFVAELVHGTPLARLLDRWYGFWVTTVLAALAFVYLSARSDRRRNFALACGVLWLVGVWIYLAVPALGPCYTSPDVFAGLTSEMPSARAGQAALWGNYARMLAGRDGTLKEFNPYFGVAAFPSLHVGAHWLFALWARRHLRALFVPLAVATGLTFMASLATGWHYAVDGYAGMLLAWLAVRVADRFEPVSAAPEAEGQQDVGDEQTGDQRDRDQDHPEGRLDTEHDVALEQRGEAAITDRAGNQQQNRGDQQERLGAAGQAAVEAGGETDGQRAQEHAELRRDEDAAEAAGLESEDPGADDPRRL